jgi:hypothetical protein
MGSGDEATGDVGVGVQAAETSKTIDRAAIAMDFIC